MKILYMTDLHLTAKSPASRLDVYYQTTFNKLKEIGEIIKTQSIDIVLCGGDLFHTPTVSVNYAGQIAQIIKSWGKPLIVVPGNHDIYGYNISTINQTMLGFYAQTGVVRLLTTNNPIKILLGGKNLVIEGREYYDGIDDKPENYEPIVPSDFTILVNHGMLMDKPYLPDVKYTLTKDIINPADITLGGHYHPGYIEHEYNDKWFFNPGSLLRVEASAGNKTFNPKVIVFELTESQGLIDWIYEYKYLKSALPSNQIFDYNSIQQQKSQSNLLNQFKQFVSNTSNISTVMSIGDMIKQACADNNIDQRVTNTALNYMGNAQVNDATSLKAKGFMENPNKVHITKLVLKNFQSHANTEIDFTDGLNAIIGESNMGKTAILRALQWVLYNEPKGADFIRTGTNDCLVSLYLSDGTIITRERDKNSAGAYIINYPDGTSQVYKGFGNDIPIQIFNAHQMPYVALSKDVEVSLNVASQLDGPFLLSLNAAEKANAIGRIIDTQTLDSAIKDVSKDITNATRDLSSLKKSLKDKESQLPLYDHLPKMKASIDQTEQFIEYIEKLSMEITELQNVWTEYTNAYWNIDKLNAELNDYKVLDKIIPNLKIMKDVMFAIEEAEELVRQYKLSENTISIITNKLTLYADMDNIVDSVNKGKLFLQKLEEINDLYKDYTVYDKAADDIMCKLSFIPAVDTNKIEELKSLYEENNILNNIYNDYLVYTDRVTIYEKHLKTAENTENNYKAVLKDTQEEFKGYLEENNICPLCNSPLDEHAINHIVEV